MDENEENMNTFREIEAFIMNQIALMNDPTLTKEKYLERLNENYSEMPDIMTRYQIDMLHKMDQFHPSPVSTPSSMNHALAEREQMGKEDKYSTLGGRKRKYTRKARRSSSYARPYRNRKKTNRRRKKI